MLAKKSFLRRILVVVLAAMMTAMLATGALAASVTVTAGEGSGNTVVLDLVVESNSTYAGVEFGVKLSNEDAFGTLSVSSSLPGVTIVGPVEARGTHYFAVIATGAPFNGTTNLGQLTFTYSGTSTETITFNEVKVVRVEGETTSSETPTKTPVITLRPASDEPTNPTNPTGTTPPSGTPRPSTPPSTSPSSTPRPSTSPAGTPPPTSTPPTNSTGSTTINGNNGTVLISIDDNEAARSGGAQSEYFTDVGESWSWAIQEIDYLYREGVIQGIGGDRYAPGSNIKRGDFMLMLVRAFKLSADYTDNFRDVAESRYYYDAIAIAKALGIAKGDGTNFNPETSITRQEAMTLVGRILEYLGTDLPAPTEASLSIFADRGQIASYARDYISALVQLGVIKGSGSNLNPLANTSRAEMAVIVYRMLMLP